MSITAEHNRAISHLTINGAVETNKLIRELASLLCLKGAKVEASLCTGKYRGTCDYYIAYDGGWISLANINNSRNKSDTTGRVINALTETLSEYRELFANKKSIWAALKERELRDNELALEMGLKQYSLKRMGVATIGGHCGWTYVVLDIDGKGRLHTESNLNHAIMHCKIDEIQNVRKKYYPAGNYKDDEIDFIQGGVGFVFDKNGYTVEHEGVTVIGEEEVA